MLFIYFKVKTTVCGLLLKSNSKKNKTGLDIIKPDMSKLLYKGQYLFYKRKVKWTFWLIIAYSQVCCCLQLCKKLVFICDLSSRQILINFESWHKCLYKLPEKKKKKRNWEKDIFCLYGLTWLGLHCTLLWRLTNDRLVYMKHSANSMRCLGICST